MSVNRWISESGAVDFQSGAIPLFGPWPFFFWKLVLLACRACLQGLGLARGWWQWCGGGKFGELPGGSLGCAPRLCEVWEQSDCLLLPNFILGLRSVLRYFIVAAQRLLGFFPSLARRDEGNTALKKDPWCRINTISKWKCSLTLKRLSHQSFTWAPEV